MKTFFAIFLLGFSVSSMACPNIIGKYYCPEEALDEFALGSQELTLNRGRFFFDGMFFLTAGEGEPEMYELSTWNPDLDTVDGMVIQRRAECSEDVVSLKIKAMQTEGDLTIEMTQAYEVAPIEGGINFKVVVDGDFEAFNFDCKKL